MIAIGTDHGGYNVKAALLKHLKDCGYKYKDFGCYSNDACDYPDFAEKVCDSIISGECELGILICGTGIGISISANKMRGIRAALCHDVFSAKATKFHNDANVLCMGERVIGVGHMIEIVDAFLTTHFSNEDRHIKRIDKITQIENKNFK